MSRNSEKSQSMLYRFREQQAAEMGIIDFNRARRPKVISSVNSIPVCEKWRSQVVREIGRKVMKIQDPALSDFQIRDLNDEINKLMKEKHVWEIQLKNLGGPNYLRGGSTQTVFDENGNEVPVVLGSKTGYKYFGRARELPDVKELIDIELKNRKNQETQASKENELQRLFNDLPAEYYGLAEEDLKFLDQEKNYSKHRYTEILNNSAYDNNNELVEIQNFEIPTQEQVEAFLITRMKQKIQDRYSLETN